jgi:hypothetical protein
VEASKFSIIIDHCSIVDLDRASNKQLSSTKSTAQINLSRANQPPPVLPQQQRCLQQKLLL